MLLFQLPLHFKLLVVFSIFHIFILNKFCHSQTFELTIESEFDIFSHDALELANGSFLILSQSALGDYSENNYPIIKLFHIDTAGTIINTLRIDLTEKPYKAWYMLRLIQNNENDFLILGNVYDNYTLLYNQYIGHVSADLDFISDTIVEVYGNYSDFAYDFLLNKDSNIIAVGRDEITPNQRLFIKEFTQSGMLLNRKWYHTGAYTFTSVVEFPISSVYHLATLYNDYEIIELDASSLEIKNRVDIAMTLQPSKMLMNPSGNKYAVAGKKSHYSRMEFKIAYFLADKDLEVSNLNYYGVPDTNYFYMQNCIDFLNDTTLYLAGTHNFKQSPPFLYPEPRWIFLNKLGTDGSIIWQRFYKGDLNYMPYVVVATNDGGALIISHQYDWNNPIPNQRDIHILKVDSTGWYEGMPVNINDPDAPKQILVYPNPVYDHVTFELGMYRDLDLKVYNQKGQVVFERKLAHSQTIKLAALPSGIYFYVIESNEGFTERGKLLKR